MPRKFREPKLAVVRLSVLRCDQCWEPQEEGEFVGARGQRVTWCKGCRSRYRSGSYGERGSVPRRHLRVVSSEPPRVTFSEKSGNKKLGGIPAAIVSPETCPPSCGFYGRGCFAEFSFMGKHWRNVEHAGLEWQDFLARVRALPPKQLWRYAVAGDLPGIGDELDVTLLDELTAANKHKRGFTFTHKPLLAGKEQSVVYRANHSGFTINLSADTLKEADRKVKLNIAPVVVVLPKDAPLHPKTPAGHHVVVCPAETRDHVTCSSCELCYVKHRKAIVGFRAHGQMHRTVSKIASGSSSS